MPKAQGRGAVACFNCHRQKVRCNGDKPCLRCHSRHKECVYPARETMIPVPESYLARIDSTLAELREMVRQQAQAVGTPQPTAGLDKNVVHDRLNDHRDAASGTVSAAGTDALVDDATAESFVRKLREILHQEPSKRSAVRAKAPSERRHAVMRFDTLYSQLNYRLPPYAYAVQLVSTTEREFGDYHMFLRKRFWKRLHTTYRQLSSQSGDRSWLCRLSLVLALAEAGSTRNAQIRTASLEIPPPPPSSSSSSSSTQSSTGPSSWPGACPTLSSGVEFFEQGLALLKVSWEEPTVEDVEALNLAAHCSYILNRRRSAYTYAGQSIRLAHSLGLDRPAPVSLSPLEREHRKRVWWTAFCMDRSTSAELGLRPAHVGPLEDLGYPDASDLDPEEASEFFDPELLRGQITVSELKSLVVDTVHQLKNRDIQQPYKILGACLQRLRDARENVTPERLAGAGPDPPEFRITASILLRYHQCYILLLRPILIHQFAYLLRDDTAVTLSDDIRSVNSTCLEAARANAKILLDLADSGKLVKYGYWDPMHLVSCLMILSLATLMSSRVPDAFRSSALEVKQDLSTYQKCRDILVVLVQGGNIPSKYHLSMLEEVEALGETMAPPGNVEIELDLHHWNDLRMPPEFLSYEFLSSFHG